MRMCFSSPLMCSIFASVCLDIESVAVQLGDDQLAFAADADTAELAPEPDGVVAAAGKVFA